MTPPPAPAGVRLFALLGLRGEAQRFVAVGAQFPSGGCAVEWFSGPQLTKYESVEQVLAVHSDGVELIWATVSADDE